MESVEKGGGRKRGYRRGRSEEGETEGKKPHLKPLDFITFCRGTGEKEAEEGGEQEGKKGKGEKKKRWLIFLVRLCATMGKKRKGGGGGFERGGGGGGKKKREKDASVFSSLLIVVMEEKEEKGRKL